MWLRNIVILTILLLCAVEWIQAQPDTVKKDSMQVYKDIEAFSEKSKFTRFMYGMVFHKVPGNQSKAGVKHKRHKNRINKSYHSFEGKTIRNIHIQTLDPFGYSIADTGLVPSNIYVNRANKIHVKSQILSINNLLLIRENQPFDSLLVKESERLVRSRRYVRDVSFFAKLTASGSDSVDIFIREMDKWSFIPDMAVSSSEINVSFRETNFLGFGHGLNLETGWYNKTHDFVYNLKYVIPNIRNTYVNSTLILSQDQNKNAIKSFAIDRPFFSPYAKWAAGVDFIHTRKDSIWARDTLEIPLLYKSNSQDYWAGSSIRIFKGNAESKRNTNFIVAARYFQNHYVEKPSGFTDIQNKFSDEKLYLASIGISTRKYIQDNYILRFGITEDIPIGKVFNLTGGYQEKANSNRFYIGARASIGNYHRWGYFSTNYEYGTYIRSAHTEQGLFMASITYFTELMEFGRWKFRQFAKPQVLIGINRFQYDSLTLNDGYGLDGFNSTSLSGTSRLLFTLQTQSYAPWNLIGFHFGPFLILSLGMLGDPGTGFRNNKVYSQIALGVLIKNENLVISTFQLSFAYYPFIPGKGQNIFKFNSFKTNDFSFRDFDIGKPAESIYK